MYWQKRFNRENPNKELEEKILEIRSINKDWGYRRVYGALRKQGILINKKKDFGCIIIISMVLVTPIANMLR